MIEERYVIDVKDQFGWVTYAYYSSEAEAKAEAKELSKSFNSNEVVLIDRENSVVVNFKS